MHSQIEAILFDFDGVLADTEPLHWSCWNEALQTLGVSITWEAYSAHCIGISDKAFLEALGRVSTPPRSLDELWPTYPLKKKLFAERATRGGLISAETKALLEELHSIPLAVVTSSATSEIRAILETEKVLDCFQATVYGDEVTNLKPHPEPYLTAMQRLGVSSAIVLEDSGPGIASGRAAGCEVLEVKHASDVPALLRARLNGQLSLPASLLE
ncbi:HAD family hydrolase [Paludibaculum fermentans]|uniref:HAD family hydrolase n=1 Tax=Paludibaculum fermentans TaxID=1473598 RepID=UPI003EBB0144